MRLISGNRRPQPASHRRSGVRKSIRLRVESLEDRTLLTIALLTGPNWSADGPASIVGGANTRIPAQNNPVAGAISRLAADPSNANILYAGTVNGGVWKTSNALAASPTWTPLTDNFPSLSIGALELDPTNSTHLVAGLGRFSADAGYGGPRAGLLLSTDSGVDWTLTNGNGTLTGVNIVGAAIRGSTIVVAANYSDTIFLATVGIFRSTDGGAHFTQISVGNGSTTGLPGGYAYDLAADPSNNAVLYTNIAFADGVGGVSGIYKSTDTGATWTKVSDATVDATFLMNAEDNVKIAVGSLNNVYVGVIIGGNGQEARIFRNGSGGSGAWTAMDLPGTNENGTFEGINPGGQGGTHFSLVADPANANLVYVGGDRQPASNGDTGGFPNSIGATSFSGRLFRGDASHPSGSQWTPLTDNFTSSGTGPHADSRKLLFDHSGSLLESDDGGVYRPPALLPIAATGPRSTATCRSPSSTPSLTTPTRASSSAGPRTMVRRSRIVPAAPPGPNSKGATAATWPSIPPRRRVTRSGTLAPKISILSFGASGTRTTTSSVSSSWDWW
jgi:hypothetical protein